jgi:nucleoside recognition membrane protein YjiH
MSTKKSKFSLHLPTGIPCLVIVVALFWYLGHVMGMAQMLNTIMHTAHDLLLNTVFYLMGICVVTGAIGRLFVEFGVVKLLERLLKPLMKPLFNLPGVASLGAVMTFLSDNPAIISLAQDKRFSSYFKKYQFISLTNFGTAFGMGLLVMVFMIGQGFFWEPVVGLCGAFVGCIVSTRLMQRFVLKRYPNFVHENVVDPETLEEEENNDKVKNQSTFIRILNSLLDGGRTGVDVGIAIIPGVLIISTFVMILTFGPSEAGEYTGAAYEGVAALPWLADRISIVFEWLFGFHDPHLIAFPITALGMCWSGFLSTHTAMLDSLGYRELTPKAILAHTIGGLCAAIFAHWVYVVIALCI